jgi:hypothetical protein
LWAEAIISSSVNATSFVELSVSHYSLIGHKFILSESRGKSERSLHWRSHAEAVIGAPLPIFWQFRDIRRDPPRLYRAQSGCTPGAALNLHLAFDFLDQNQRWLARGSC